MHSDSLAPTELDLLGKSLGSGKSAMFRWFSLPNYPLLRPVHLSGVLNQRSQLIRCMYMEMSAYNIVQPILYTCKCTCETVRFTIYILHINTYMYMTLYHRSSIHPILFRSFWTANPEASTVNRKRPEVMYLPQISSSILVEPKAGSGLML